MTVPNSHLGRVQVLRFFAASAVLFAHLQKEVLVHFSDVKGFRPFVLIDGGFGVDLFFVISGFIMYHVSADKFGQPGASKDFLIRRYMRIAPLYYLTTLLMLAATAAFGGAVSIARPDPAHVASSFLFFPWTNQLDEIVPVLKLGWTLNFEAYFYVVFGLALAFGRRTGLTLMVSFLSAMVILAQVLPQPPTAITFWGQSLVFEFLGGIAIAICYRRGLRLSAPAALLVIAGGLLMIVALRAAGFMPLLPRGVSAGVPAWLIVAAVVCAPFDERQGRLKTLLVAGGEASFALYVVHPFGLRAGALIWNSLRLPSQPWLYVAAMMLVVILAAFAVNVLVERPLDRSLRRWLDATRPSKGATVMPDS
jgi:exopolysaccharide production protein ExoZ